MDKHYGGVIWTDHALQRLRERGISQGTAYATLRKADSSRYAATKKAYVYYKTWETTKVEVVAKQNERKEWVVLSVWARPDYTAKKRSFWRKLFKLLTSF